MPKDFLKCVRDRYDCIVIGSGLAGLTAANTLARSGHSVLLLEQHYKLGGMATWFKRPGGHIFDISLHGFPVGMIKSCRRYWTQEIADSIVQLKNIRFDNPMFSLTTTFNRDDFTRLLVEKFRVPAASVFSLDETKRHPKSAELGKRVTINFAATTAEARPYNVVGLWEGSDPKLKDEWISLAAHLDGAVRAGGEIPGNTLPNQYNAADDNASGSAGNLAIARAIVAGPRPRRSILMIWDSGEETGLWGTRFIAYGPWSNKLVLHVSNDMIGRSRAPNSARIQNLSSADSIYVTGPKLLSSKSQAHLMRAAKEFPFIALDQVYEDVTSEFYYPRTDAGPYLENGIPIMQFFNGTTPEYHQPTDEPRLLDIAKISNVSKLSYGALWLAADDPERPRWDGPVPYTLWWVSPKNR